ncbi:MAG: hypothetical protein M3066_09560 [Actinomycetota bacterium]|nr:hypothetical protein [Actinomycetota bacterium]
MLLSYGAVAPCRPLDPVAAEVWQLAIEPLGLPLVLRALAAWWRVADEIEGSPHPAPALASGLVRLVSARAGVPRTGVPVAAADDLAVGAAARFLDRHLRLSRHRLW